MLSNYVPHPIRLTQIPSLEIPDTGLSYDVLAFAMSDVADLMPKDAIGVVRAEQGGPWGRIVGDDSDSAAFLYPDGNPERFETLRRWHVTNAWTGKAEETHSPRVRNILARLISIRQALNIEEQITRVGTTAILLRPLSIILIDRNDCRTGRIMMHPSSGGHDVFEEIEFLQKGFDTIFTFGDPIDAS